MSRVVIKLSKPIVASNDCLPHAAMNLGSAGGVGLTPRPGLVYQLVLQKQYGNWVLYRMDDRGGFVGDTWHGTFEDAAHQARREFGVELPTPAE